MKHFQFKEKEGDYINLKCLMTEENETVHQIEKEMKSLFSNADIREWDKISAQDKSGKSKIFGTSFDLNSGTM